MKKYFEKFGHSCELDDDVKVESSRREKIKETIVIWTTIDPTSDITLHHFNSHSAIVNERKFHLENHPRTIHPFSRLKLWIWEPVFVLVFLCALISGPLMFFDYIQKTDLYVEDMKYMYCVYVFCVIDMFLRFFNGFVVKKKFMVRKIAK
jgi:hypothetical protein